MYDKIGTAHISDSTFVDSTYVCYISWFHLIFNIVINVIPFFLISDHICHLLDLFHDGNKKSNYYILIFLFFFLGLMNDNVTFYFKGTYKN